MKQNATERTDGLDPNDYQLTKRDYLDLWIHCEEVGGRDKDRMVTLVTWLLAFAAAILGYVCIGSTDLESWRVGMLCMIGCSVSVLSLIFIYAFGAYANRYWHMADSLRDRITGLSELHDKEVFVAAVAKTPAKYPLRKAEKWMLKRWANAGEPTEGLVGVFKVLRWCTLALALLFVVLCIFALRSGATENDKQRASHSETSSAVEIHGRVGS